MNWGRVKNFNYFYNKKKISLVEAIDVVMI